MKVGEGWEKRKKVSVPLCALPWSPDWAKQLLSVWARCWRSEQPELEAEPWGLAAAGFGLCLALEVPCLSPPCLLLLLLQCSEHLWP